MPQRLMKSKTPFTTSVGGIPVVVRRGELVPADHELVKANPAYFEPAEQHTRFTVEQATAAPGEKRMNEPRTRAGRNRQQQETV